MAVRFGFDERFVGAIAHDEHRVLGERLRPYSNWHELNLQLINSPILTGEPVRLTDLVAAVRICVSRYTVGCPTPDLVARGWRARWRWKWRLIRGVNLSEEVRKFGDYLEDFRTGPKFWKNDHLGKASEADKEFDDTLEAVAWMMFKGGLSPEAAWNHPMGLARWYCAAFTKWSGSKDMMIWTPIHDQMFAAHKKKKEAQIAKRAEELAAEGMEKGEARAKAEAEYKARADAGLARVRGGVANGKPAKRTA